MNIASLLKKDEPTAGPFSSMQSLEDTLLTSKYVAILDGRRFIGLITPQDCLRHPHLLAVDCIEERPALSPDDSLEHAVEVMTSGGFRALPVVDTNGTYLGSITLERLLLETFSMFHSNIQISIVRPTEDYPLEKAKADFLKDLAHHTGNPLQIILSATYLLSQNVTSQDDSLLISAIQDSVRVLQALFAELCQAYADS